MATRPRRRRHPVHLRHKILGSLLVLAGLACMAACGLLTGYLAANFLGGNTKEILVLDAFSFLLGLLFLFMAWHQFVVAPKQDDMRQSLRSYRRKPQLEKTGANTTD